MRKRLVIYTAVLVVMLVGCGKNSSENGNKNGAVRTTTTVTAEEKTIDEEKSTESITTEEDKTTADTKEGATDNETVETAPTESASNTELITGPVVQIRKMMYMPGQEGIEAWEFECDENGNVVVEKSKLTSTVVYCYYDEAGNKTKAAIYSGDVLEQENEYDQQGREKKIINYTDGKLSSMYEYTYGDHDTYESIVFTNADGEKYSSENKSIYEYDSEGRVVVEKKKDGNDIYICNRYEYDAAGNMTKSMKYKIEWNDNTIRETHEYIYDDEGRLVFEKVFDYDGRLNRWFAYEFSDGTGVVDENVREKLEGEFYIKPVDSIELKEWIGKDLKEYLDLHPDYHINELYEGYAYAYEGMSIVSHYGEIIEEIDIWGPGDYSINGVMYGMNYKMDASYRFGVGGEVEQASESDYSVAFQYKDGRTLVYELDDNGNIIYIQLY